MAYPTLDTMRRLVTKYNHILRVAAVHSKSKAALIKTVESDLG